MHCSGTRKFCKIELMIYMRGQSHPVSKLYKYTRDDVVMMGLCAANRGDVLRWLIDDSPQTPKIVITDTKTESDPMHCDTVQNCGSEVSDGCVLDWRSSCIDFNGDMILHALRESTETPLSTFSP